MAGVLQPRSRKHAGGQFDKGIRKGFRVACAPASTTRSAVQVTLGCAKAAGEAAISLERRFTRCGYASNAICTIGHATYCSCCALHKTSSLAAQSLVKGNLSKHLGQVQHTPCVLPSSCSARPVTSAGLERPKLHPVAR